MYFFQDGALVSIENAKVWPIVAHLGYFVANLHTFWCTFTGGGGVPKLIIMMFASAQMAFITSHVSQLTCYFFSGLGNLTSIKFKLIGLTLHTWA